MYALSAGFPGLLKSSSTRFQYAQRSGAFEVNSVPLSTRMRLGLVPLWPEALSRILATSVPLNFLPATSATHFLLQMSMTVRTRIVRPSLSVSCMKSIAHCSLALPGAVRATRAAALRSHLGRRLFSLSSSPVYSR
jgi:hypothetical protein